MVCAEEMASNYEWNRQYAAARGTVLKAALNTIRCTKCQKDLSPDLFVENLFVYAAAYREGIKLTHSAMAIDPLERAKCMLCKEKRRQEAAARKGGGKRGGRSVRGRRGRGGKRGFVRSQTC